jgi:hypothetical protein
LPFRISSSHPSRIIYYSIAILYRSGDDHINWHADDTQKEEIVLAATVISPSEPRKLRTRPKGDKSFFVEGYEEWEFFVGPGDGYVMDGK